MSQLSSHFLSARSASRTILALRLRWVLEEQGPGSPNPLEIAKRVVVDYGGRIASTSLDGLLAELRSPTDTLQCAAALQDRFASERESGALIEARVGVAIGEVVRDPQDPLGLSGGAVEEARELVDRAAEGEVLFTRGVFLAMTLSEVPWEIETTAAAEEAEPIHRLVPLLGGGLPFGTAGLESRRPARVRLLKRQGSDLLAEGSLRGWSALRSAPRRIARNLIPIVLGLVAAGLAVAALIAMQHPWPPPAIEAALRVGRDEQALQLVEDWVSRAPHRAVRQAWKGRVLAHHGELDQARQLLGDATRSAPRLANNPALAWGLVLTLDAKGPERSLLRRNRTTALEEALVDATRSTSYWLRSNAVTILESFGLEDRIDRVDVYLLDLEYGTSCGVRVRAAKELAQLGDPRAIPLLESARAEGHPNAACNLKRVAADALRSLGAG